MMFRLVLVGLGREFKAEDMKEILMLESIKIIRKLIF